MAVQVINGLYTAKHGCIVDLTAAAVREMLPTGVIMYQYPHVMLGWFNVSHDLFCNISITPGVVFCDEGCRKVLILEIGCF